MKNKKVVFKVGATALALSMGLTALGPASSAFAAENSTVSNVQGTSLQNERIIGDSLVVNDPKDLEGMSIIDNGGTFKGKESEFDNIQNYFKLDNNGEIVFDRDKALNELNLSTEEVNLLTRITNEMTNIDGSGIQARGWVGIKVKFGPEVRKMNGVTAGAFVAGYIGFKLKAMAAAGPWGAGAAAAITAFAAGAVGIAVSNGLKSVELGINIYGVSWSASVTTP